ncbi:Transmembrane protein [Porphyridium purpureum]|uniref:Transmembrane protein n=1 Tax=Porphyridium purpureum TaxID=35688 RepID=A0A5J4YTY1_PORPP|nr:Transmembrane protein [Porphyridium purpureum]|eukprot:POR3467..scf229_5
MASKAVLRVGALLGVTSVAAGAYGSHMLEAHYQADMPGRLDDDDVKRWKSVYDTGFKMHMFGAASTMALAGCTSVMARPTLAPALLCVGTVVFSGSCYAAAYKADRNLGAGAPFGGTAMMMGCLAALL